MASNPTLVAVDVSFSYGRRTVIQYLSLGIREGQSVAVTGPNGSGKTTLLRLLAGSLHPDKGEVRLLGVPLRAWTGHERARHIAVVSQHVEPTLTLSVESVVALGRTPYTGFLGSQTRTDRVAIEAALDATDARVFVGRRFSELSGGEQQRVMLATALAQQPQFLLLDEPTIHLDLEHQYALLELLNRLKQDHGIGILAVMHDLNLAGLYFDRIAVLADGHLAAEGTSADVLNRTDLGSLFHAPLRVVPHPDTQQPQVLLRPGQ